jgi:hypothetical protein
MPADDSLGIAALETGCLARRIEGSEVLGIERDHRDLADGLESCVNKGLACIPGYPLDAAALPVSPPISLS